jgi:hypothetical protein
MVTVLQFGADTVVIKMGMYDKGHNIDSAQRYRVFTLPIFCKADWTSGWS